MHEYDLIADWYAMDRNGEIGVPEVASLVASLAVGARVLDIGCGNGVPLTRALLARGCKVVGVDSSSRMLERFRTNCPEATAIHGQVQTSDLDGVPFDAAIAWGVLFHMEHAEQIKTIEKVAEALKPEGWFLFTSGDEDGSIQGLPMNGVPFRYWSFSVESYRRVLKEHGMILRETHRDQGHNIYYLAQKADRPSDLKSA
jgi:SAM-dependent methyltransferase